MSIRDHRPDPASHDAQAGEIIGHLDHRSAVPAYIVGGCAPLGAQGGGLYGSPPPSGLPDLSEIAIAAPAGPLPTPPQPGASPFPPPGGIIYETPPMPPAPAPIVISVYLDDGRVFEYDVNTPSQAREHTAAIIAGGYRSCSNPPEPKLDINQLLKRAVDNAAPSMSSEIGVMEHYPPHRILKVKASGPGIRTNYPDRIRGT